MHVSLKNNNRCHSKLAQLLVSLQENRTLSPAPATRVSDPLSLWDENSKNRLLGTCLCSHSTLRRPCPYFFSSLTPIVIPRGSSAAEPSHFLVSLRLVLLPSMGAAALANANPLGRGTRPGRKPGALAGPSAAMAALDHCSPVVLSSTSILRLFCCHG